MPSPTKHPEGSEDQYENIISQTLGTPSYLPRLAVGRMANSAEWSAGPALPPPDFIAGCCSANRPGKVVSVQLAKQGTITGTITFLDLESFLVGIINPSRVLSVVSLVNIQSCQVVPDGKQTVISLPDSLPTKKDIQERTAKNLKLAKERDAKLGVGVDEDAQVMRSRVTPSRLFDAIGKTMHVQWQGTSIVVADQVVIAPPYDKVTENAKVAAGTVDRVKVVLGGLRRKLGLQ
ncbi:protein with role in RNA processing [Kappamyces sp. JEL0829]|nr:protein with role in RNA processing [Kappamyces sp. JEL0829]